MEHTSSVEHRGSACWITMERGERNLLDADMTAWLVEALKDAESTAPVAVVLTGAGGVFCGGADGPYLRETSTAQPFADACVELFELLHTMRTPVVVALNGDSLAGGFGLICLADIVVATKDAQLGTIEASLGAWPMIAQAPVLARMPAKAALTNLLTGVPFTASRGLELGVVDEVVPAGELTTAIDRYVELLKPGTAAARLGRPLMRQAVDADFSTVLRSGAMAFVEMFG